MLWLICFTSATTTICHGKLCELFLYLKYTVFLVQHDSIKYKRIFIILKVVKAILKKEIHLINSDFSAAACMFYKRNAIRAPDVIKQQ